MHASSELLVVGSINMRLTVNDKRLEAMEDVTKLL